MEYCKTIEQCIHFIERNIKEELTAEQISQQAGYSVFHFCRIFAVSQGIPLMEFVRKKRLLLSRADLLISKKIIEVALDYGFKTASGYSKAFRKEFGYSPTTYISRMSGCDVKEIITNLGGIIMNPVIIRKPAFLVAGYGINTSIAENYTKDIAAYWDTYDGENLESKMYQQLNPPNHGEVGICVPNSENGSAVYLLGVIVDDFEKVTPDMMTITVPFANPSDLKVGCLLFLSRPLFIIASYFSACFLNLRFYSRLSQWFSQKHHRLSLKDHLIPSPLSFYREEPGTSHCIPW